MTSFALYRMPLQQRVVLVEQLSGQPAELDSLCQLNEATGYVLAPFSTAQGQPNLLIRPDKVTTFSNADALCQQPLLTERFQSLCLEETAEEPLPPARADYADDFSRFHAALAHGTFRKLVLARCAVVCRGAHSATPLQLFCRACSRYRQQFVALVYTPQSGLWLFATPEVLLEDTANGWHTMALAGTMPLANSEMIGSADVARHWSAKNIEEQRIVAQYISDVLRPFARQVSVAGPRTVSAAQVVHLRTDFTFTLLYNTRAGELLQALHPTPAVCGLPKEAAQAFILANEHSPRSYYSGFMGPLRLATDGEEAARQTALYVSLRCMQITARTFRLYAGGGLLPESCEAHEWQETEAKMQAMRQCIN